MNAKMLLTILLTLLMMSACSDNKECRTLTHAVTKIEATSIADLNQRKNWELLVGHYSLSSDSERKRYNYTISDNKIIGTPVSEEETEYFTRNYDCNESPTFELPLEILFVSPGYDPVVERYIPLLDQSTADKFILADVLVAGPLYAEKVSTEFNYLHSLYEYNFIDLPEGAETSLTIKGVDKDDLIVEPLVVDGVYKASIAKTWRLGMQVTVGEELYHMEFTNVLPSTKIQAPHYTFSFRLKKNTVAKDQLLIENIKVEERSK